MSATIEMEGRPLATHREASYNSAQGWTGPGVVASPNRTWAYACAPAVVVVLYCFTLGASHGQAATSSMYATIPSIATRPAQGHLRTMGRSPVHNNAAVPMSDDVYLPDSIANLPGVHISGEPTNPIALFFKKFQDMAASVFQGPGYKSGYNNVGVEAAGESWTAGMFAAIAAKIPHTPTEWLLVAASFVGILVAGYSLRRLWRQIKYKAQVINVRRATELLDMAHAQDPFMHPSTGRPRELVFIERATQWLAVLCPDASPELRLAVRAHKLESWKPRPEATRVGEFLAKAKVADLAAPVNYILDRRGDPAEPEYIAFQDAVCLTNLDGLIEAAITGQGLQSDAFLATLRQEWKQLSPKAQEVGLVMLVNPLPEPLKEQVLQQVQTVSIQAWAE